MNFRNINIISIVAACIILIIGLAAALIAFNNPAKAFNENNSRNNTILASLSEFHTLGNFVDGHDGLACRECHKYSDGSIRQQIQALAKNALFDAGYQVDFAFRKVSSSECLTCHERNNDRHPIYRFNEPRFIEVVKILPANKCLGCHSEHNAKTVNLDSLGFCASCHSELFLKNDPLDISHAEIIKTNDWNSCLGCHDFHGNHKFKSPNLYDKSVSVQAIKDYFDGGKSPYGTSKTSEGLKK